MNLSDADIVKLIQASDNEEDDASEYEKHTSDEIESKNSDNDFDTASPTNVQKRKHSIQEL